MELGGGAGGGRKGAGYRPPELLGEVPSGFQKALGAPGGAGLGPFFLPPYSTVSGLEDLKPYFIPQWALCFQRAAAFCCKRGPHGFLRFTLCWGWGQGCSFRGGGVSPCLRCVALVVCSLAGPSADLRPGLRATGNPLSGKGVLGPRVTFSLKKPSALTLEVWALEAGQALDGC